MMKSLILGTNKLSAMLIVRILIFAVMIAITGTASAIDPQYTQHYANPLLIAPSFAGNSLGSRAFVNFRDQWAKLPGSYVTYSVAIDHNFYAVNSGFGLTAVYDAAGSARLGTASATALYSYRFNLTDSWRVRPGMSFSYSQRSLNRSAAIWNDMISVTGIDPVSIEPPPRAYNYFDAAASAVVYNNTMWVGLSASHLLRPNISFARLDARIPIQWLHFGGYNFQMTSRVGRPTELITLHYLLKASALYQQFDIGVNWYRAPLLLGFAWRGIPSASNSYDCLIFTVGLGFNNIAFGYSYDFTISKLGPATGGSHEISLSISFNEGGLSQNRGAIPCPDVVKFRMFGDKEQFR